MLCELLVEDTALSRALGLGLLRAIFMKGKVGVWVEDPLHWDNDDQPLPNEKRREVVARGEDALLRRKYRYIITSPADAPGV